MQKITKEYLKLLKRKLGNAKQLMMGEQTENSLWASFMISKALLKAKWVITAQQRIAATHIMCQLKELLAGQLVMHALHQLQHLHGGRGTPQRHKQHTHNLLILSTTRYSTIAL